jgi:thioredoxin 1
MKKLDRQSYVELIEEGNGTSLVKFGAEWCGPCRSYTPILEEVEKSVGEDINIYEVDVDQEPDLAQKLNIRGVPATFIFQDGELKKSFVGVQNAYTILEIINSI